MRAALSVIGLLLLGAPAQASALTLSPLGEAGGWTVMASGTQSEPVCAARRTWASPENGAPATAMFLRLRRAGFLRVPARAGHPVGEEFAVTIAGGGVHGATSAVFTAPGEVDVALGDLVTTLARLGEAPLMLRLPGETITLPADSLDAMRSALGDCITARFGAAFAGASEPAPVAPPESAVTEERLFLDTRIGGVPHRLEALVVKPADATGRLPVALIAHGQGATETMPAYTPAHLLPEARDLALRGYLAVVVLRRGFGRSDGVPGVPSGAFGANCHDYARRLFENSAGDLTAPLESLAARPDADLARVIVIGQSAGGPAALTLAARGLPALRAVVTVSGGLRCDAPDIPAHLNEDMLAALGPRVAVPVLWLSAPNDSFLGEAMARRMHAAFTGAGGNATFVLTPPIHGDGHALFTDWHGRSHWLAALDTFLRTHDLPTWDAALADRVMQAHAIPQTHRTAVEAHLSAMTPKVLMVDRATGRPFTGTMPYGLSTARAFARLACTRDGTDCVAAMENFHVLPPAP